MRTIRELVGKEEKVYIVLRSKPIRYRFMADAAMEGIIYGDGIPATDCPGTGKSAYSIAKWKSDMAQAQYRTDACK